MSNLLTQISLLIGSSLFLFNTAQAFNPDQATGDDTFQLCDSYFGIAHCFNSPEWQVLNQAMIQYSHSIEHNKTNYTCAFEEEIPKLTHPTTGSFSPNKLYFGCYDPTQTHLRPHPLFANHIPIAIDGEIYPQDFQAKTGHSLRSIANSAVDIDRTLTQMTGGNRTAITIGRILASNALQGANATPTAGVSLALVFAGILYEGAQRTQVIEAVRADLDANSQAPKATAAFDPLEKYRSGLTSISYTNAISMVINMLADCMVPDRTKEMLLRHPYIALINEGIVYDKSPQYRYISNSHPTCQKRHHSYTVENNDA